MEYVLRAIGVVVIAIGAVVGAQIIIQMQRSGIPVQNAFLTGALGGAAGFIVIGVLIMAFGTAIELLRAIRNNTDEARER